jgi:hypothetical protein
MVALTNVRASAICCYIEILLYLSFYSYCVNVISFNLHQEDYSNTLHVSILIYRNNQCAECDHVGPDA